MTVGFLAKSLTKETVLTIKDQETKKTIWEGKAEKAVNIPGKVKDWDFSKNHTVYV